MSTYTTKATRMQDGYGCRVFCEGKLVVEARCDSRFMIGPTFRDLLRTIDTLGGDEFTSAARDRKHRDGNYSAQVKHYWSGKPPEGARE